ncbi:hypothetical protein AB6A40_007687 [Gnathostoma spinigerum]|uniref:C2H2-type domain-containing protein n=1 Tax=Gnathostoma spinigerum TaxID=75299 RepID=A0ABD6ELY4_9BILA
MSICIGLGVHSFSFLSQNWMAEEGLPDHDFTASSSSMYSRSPSCDVTSNFDSFSQRGVNTNVLKVSGRQMQSDARNSCSRLMNQRNLRVQNYFPYRSPKNDGDEYVRKLVSSLKGQVDSFIRPKKIAASQQTDAAILSRLYQRDDCDLLSLSCMVPMCGRTFDCIQVLAWHMSYAHQDVSKKDGNNICYLCGYVMSSAKGKNAHLTTKHRLFAERHNIQCLEQRDSISFSEVTADVLRQNCLVDEELVERIQSPPVSYVDLASYHEPPNFYKKRHTDEIERIVVDDLL